MIVREEHQFHQKNMEQALKLAATSVTTKYIALKASATLYGRNVNSNTLEKFITETENEFGLTNCSFKTGTVKLRKLSFYPTGFAPQRTYPIADIEPLILQRVILIADMGQPLTKTGIIALANEAIDNTCHSRCLFHFKQKRNINNVTNVGASWFKGFLSRHSEFLKISKCKIKDQNCINWCTYENVSNMYDGVYRSMVKAGVAVKMPKESDEINMYGRATKFKLIKTENVVFVEETGCNTNQKTGGHIGGELFILPSGESNTGVK
jgi:hypothetical protein